MRAHRGVMRACRPVMRVRRPVMRVCRGVMRGVPLQGLAHDARWHAECTSSCRDPYVILRARRSVNRSELRDRQNLRECVRGCGDPLEVCAKRCEKRVRCARRASGSHRAGRVDNHFSFRDRLDLKLNVGGDGVNEDWRPDIHGVEDRASDGSWDGRSSPFKVRVTSPRASAPPLSIDGEGLSPCFQVVCHLLAGKSPLAIHGEGAHGSAG